MNKINTQKKAKGPAMTRVWTRLWTRFFTAAVMATTTLILIMFMGDVRAAAPNTVEPRATQQGLDGVDDAHQLVNALLGQFDGAVPQPFLLTPVATEDALQKEALTFASAIERALVGQHELEVVSRASLQAMIQELALSGEALDGAMAELAGGMGAKTMLNLSYRAAAGGVYCELVVLDITTGNILAQATIQRQHVDHDSSPAFEARDLQTQLRRLGDDIASALGRLEGDARYQRFAVLPFHEVGEQTKAKQLGLLVSSEVSTRLRNRHDMILVERNQLGKVMNEIALGQSGAIDENQSIEFGRLSGAQAMVIGTVSEAGDRYLVNARVVSAATGRVLVAQETTLAAADLIALSADAVVLRTTGGAIYRSVLMPGWGQLYNRQPVKAGAFAIGEALGLLGAGFFHIQARDLHIDYQNMTAGAELDATVLKEKNALVNRNNFIYAVAAMHIIGIIDAFIAGKSYGSALPSNSSGSGSSSSGSGITLATW